jgi:peptidoglycan/LPS O-acetylase OafA/YrhL
MRNRRLDVLRCLAVLLVIAQHMNTGKVTFGWVGVDLFFVLSGFLISGLLFTEYKERGAVNVGRFYLRRGLKLYPSFYVMLAATAVLDPLSGQSHGASQYLGELFYIQNYAAWIWPHTWSLAVEEHFYFLLPLLLIGLAYRYAGSRDPFGAVPWVFAILALGCLGARIWMVGHMPQAWLLDWRLTRPVAAETHVRIDSLFFGVLLGYLYHFRSLEEWVRRHIGVLVGLAIPLLAVSFVNPGSRFILTAGFTILYLGFGIALMLALTMRDVLPGTLRSGSAGIGNAMAYIGMYSYSIYLWHLPVRIYLPLAVARITGFHMGARRTDLLYVPLAIVTGIVMSKLVEWPILRLRDRVLPARHAPIKQSVGSNLGPDGPEGKDVASVRIPSPRANVVKVDLH